MDWIFTQEELKWLDDIMPEDKRNKKDKKKKKGEEDDDDQDEEVSDSI